LTYTGGPWPHGYHALGEVLVFLFFGLVAVLGTAYLQTRAVTGTGLAVAVAMGSFAGAILVANNLRDVASDGRAGKRTLAVVLGVRRTQVVFGGLLALPFVACLSVAGGRGHRADRSGAGRRRGALWSALVGRCARRRLRLGRERAAQHPALAARTTPLRARHPGRAAGVPAAGLRPPPRSFTHAVVVVGT
jgi:UbiA prenyltransferase family